MFFVLLGRQGREGVVATQVLSRTLGLTTLTRKRRKRPRCNVNLVRRHVRKAKVASMDGHSWWMASTRVGEWRPVETSATRPEPNSLRTSSATTRVRAAAIGSQWSSNQKICSLHRDGAGKKLRNKSSSRTRQQQEQFDVEMTQLKQE
ncbi:hypothetical protein JG688_00010583, partial [Phytophthora aleatoria]